MVTASKVSSRNGSRVPSPATNGRLGRSFLPCRSIPTEKSQATAVAPCAPNGSLEQPVPAARSSTRSPARGATAATIERRQLRWMPAVIRSLVRS